MDYLFLENFGKDHPQYDVNLARMRNDAHREKMTLFVEGEDDRDFFRSFLKDRSSWKIEYGPKKSGVLERFQKYKENPTVPYAMFCVDLDFDFALELMEECRGGSGIVEDEQLFYQLFDVEQRQGYNDLETFLFMSDAYSSMMVEYYDDDDKIQDVRSGILKMGISMGIFRVANILVRRKLGLPQDATMLSQGLRDGSKFGVRFMEEFGLIEFGQMNVLSVDGIGEVLLLAFGKGPYGDHLPSVILCAHEILNFLENNPNYFANFLRGHDLMELLARKMVFDRKHQGTSFKSKKKAFVDDGSLDFEKLRDELESDLRKSAGNSLDSLKRFPLGRLLK